MSSATAIALAGSLLALVLVGFIVFFVIAYRRRQLAHQKEKEQMQLLFERDAMLAQLEISEATLKKVSAEVHDNIGQRLTLARLQLINAAQEDGREHLGKALELVSQAIQDLRNLTRSLNGTFILDHGLVASIRRETEMIADSGMIRTSLNHEGEYPELPPHHEIILFRCVQEALNNSVRHSGCSLLQISVEVRDLGLLITVSDDGCGIPEGYRPGLGLSNIAERMKGMGGEMLIQTRNGKGTELKLILPSAAIHATEL